MATPIPENTAPFTLGRLVQLLSPRLNEAASGLRADCRMTGISTDTRGDLRGKVFIALSGERYDAHRFLTSAAASGAALAIVEQEVPDAPPALPQLRVSSTLDALATLAGAHRVAWGKRLIAVAGSAGKTTTRSLAACLLSRLEPGRVHTTTGNLNNRVGVPMVLLGLTPEHDYAVIEIGTNQPGEVDALARVAVPELGLLTLIALEHSEGLGGLDAIELEEGALYNHTSQSVIGNGDDPRVRRQTTLHRERCATLLYGYEQHNDYRVLDAVLREEAPKDSAGGNRPGLCMRVKVARPDGTQLTFHTPFIGTPGVLSSLGALASVEALLETRASTESIEAAFFDPAARQSGRLQPHQLLDGTLVIDDSYNANPASMLAGLAIAAALAQLRGSQLHAVLGHMGELGTFSENEHRRVGSELAKLELASLTTIGGDAKLMLPSGQKNAAFVPSAELVPEILRSHLRAGDVVFVKASRSIAAERVVQGLLDHAVPNKETARHS